MLVQYFALAIALFPTNGYVQGGRIEYSPADNVTSTKSSTDQDTTTEPSTYEQTECEKATIQRHIVVEHGDFTAFIVESEYENQPVNGQWSRWTDSDCLATCGLGYRVRLRTCTEPTPSYGGAQCEGPTMQTESCVKENCPVDGYWSSWATGSCSASCGIGNKIRTRNCINPTVGSGGEECKGYTEETMLCREAECPETKATDCSDIILQSGRKETGVQKVKITGVTRGIDVFCDQNTTGGGWLVIQRRVDGSEDFYRGWVEYKYGFGNVSGEFWLGNEIISRIMKGRKFELRVELEDFDGESRYADYKSFSIGDASTNYTLTVGDYSGTAGDAMWYHNGRRFVTHDSGDTYTCAAGHKGAWWFGQCSHSHLNGEYLNGEHTSHRAGVFWGHWRGLRYSYKKAEMKIRPL